MYFTIIFIIYHLLVHLSCQKLQFSNYGERIQQGKKYYEKLQDVAKSGFSACWKEALKNLDSSCRDMSDNEQSYLALQFANCHLLKSDLQTYSCTREDFRECTKLMSKDIIAFQTYTEFFTHVTDICFYLQSDLWRENTEETISKLTQTSAESLHTLMKSTEQQQQVLDAQQESLQNQKDMLINEQILKEALKTSAESAKNVFVEVREHAQQQKTLFSETFENIFQSVERLASLQEMLLGEFIGLQSVAFYFVATVVCYLFTSTPRTSSARLFLFTALTFLIITERVFVSWRVNSKSKPELTSEDIHSRIWILRKIFLLIATVILGIFIARYRDFNKINHNMLQDIQAQIMELRKLQETQQSLVLPKMENTTDSSVDGMEDKTLVDTQKHLEAATKQLELSLQAYATSTPHKLQADAFFGLQGSYHFPPEEEKKQRYDYSDGDDNGDDITIRKKCETVTKDRIVNKTKMKTNEKQTLNESKYNLRSRNNSGFGNSYFDQSRMNATQVKRKTPAKDLKGKKKKSSISKSKPAFFSSDDED